MFGSLKIIVFEQLFLILLICCCSLPSYLVSYILGGDVNLLRNSLVTQCILGPSAINHSTSWLFGHVLLLSPANKLLKDCEHVSNSNLLDCLRA